jgi:hypothetical protein
MTMFAIYVVVTILTVVATAGIAVADFLRADFVLANSAEVGVPGTWLPILGLLKLLGGIGLCAGLAGFEPVGVLAAAGLTAFFLGAVTAHVRARVFHNIAFPLGYLALSAASLALVATR